MGDYSLDNLAMANGEKRQIKDAKCLNRTLPCLRGARRRQIFSR